MDQRLVEVARVGDVMALHRIMEQDPEILEKESFGHFADSALHVAARRGKSEFVKKIVSLTPSLVTATNQKGLIPLHMASAKGHVETLKELLKAKLDDDEEVAMNQCLVKEDEGWNPLHYAVSKGRIGVVKELINHCPECAEQVTAKGETVLHLAVKANQLKVLQVIVESIKDRLPNFQALFKAKDVNANTVYDLAPTKKTFLVRLEKGKEEEKDEIKEESSITVEALEDGSLSDGGNEDEATKNNKEKKEEAEGFREFQNAVLVVATVIITLTYQCLANPPTTLFQQPGKETDWSCLSILIFSAKLNSSEWMEYYKTCRASLAFTFLVFNTVIFTLSILLLLSNLRGAYGSLLLLRLLAFFLVSNYCVFLEAITWYGRYATPLILYVSLAFLLYVLYCERTAIVEKLRRILSSK